MKLAALKVPASNPKDAIFASEQQNESTHLRHILKKIACIIDIAGCISSKYQNPQISNVSTLENYKEKITSFCIFPDSDLEVPVTRPRNYGARPNSLIPSLKSVLRSRAGAF